MSSFRDQLPWASTSSPYDSFATMQVTRQRARILPSTLLASQLRAYSSSGFSANKDASMCADSQDKSRALVANFERNFRPALESILPSSAVEQLSASPQHGDQLDRLSLMHTKLLVYACMNRMTFLQGQISNAAMCEYLKPMLSSHLFSQSLVLSAPKDFISTQSMKAMAETMFCWAIEVGDHVTVARLMALSEAAIDVNNVVCENNSTPVVRSASLGYSELTKDLILKYKADVNKDLWGHWHGETCQCSGGGALRAVLYDNGSYEETTSDLVITIINAGGTMCTQDVRMGLVLSKPHVCRHFLSLKARTACTEDWLHSGVFHEAAFCLDSTAALLMLNGMVSKDIDLAIEISWNPTRYSFYEAGRKPIDTHLPEDIVHMIYAYHDPMGVNYRHEVEPFYQIAPYPATIIDIAAQRGHLAVLQRLKQLQVKYTNDTLTAAIRSRNLPTVRYVLANRAPVDCFSRHYFTTPLAEAIQCGFAVVIPLLLNRLDLTRHLSNEHHYCALLSAAAQVSDWTWLNYLLTMTSCATGPVMGYALIKAAEFNQTQVVLSLLNAGASLNTARAWSVFGNHFPRYGLQNYDTVQQLPLMYALWNRNSILVEALLDHRGRETGGNFPQSGRPIDGCSEIIGCAVLWNDDCTIFDELICAGWNVGCGLLVASQVGKLDLVEYFLQAKPSSASLDRALSRAICQGHFSIAQELSRRGARLYGDPSWRTVVADCPDLLLQLIRPAHTFRPDLPGSLMLALIKAKREDVAKLLLDAGRFDLQPHMLLWTAIDGGASKACIIAILKSDFNLDGPIINISGPWETILLAAIRMLNLEVVLLLLRKGADVNRPPRRGLRRTPLQQAAEVGSRAIVELLLKKNADVHAVPAVRGGVTSIQAAAIGGFIGIVELLIEHGEDARAPGAQVDGRTALEGASEHGRFDMVVYLTGLGLYDVKQYKRAIRFAEDNGHQAIVRVLEEDLIEVQSLYGTGDDTSVDSDADAAATSEYELRLMINEICKDSENLAMDEDYIDVGTLPSSHLSGARIVDLDNDLYESQICEPVDVSQVIMGPLETPANHRNAAGTHRMGNSVITDLDMTGSIIDLGDDESLQPTSNNFAPELTFEESYTSTGTLALFGPSGFGPANPGLRGIDDTSNEINDGSLTVEDHEIADQEPMDWQNGSELVEPPQLRAPSPSAEQPVNEPLHGKKFKCTQPHCNFDADRNDTLTRHLVTHQTVREKRKHKCDHCSSAYSRSDSLKAHAKRCTRGTSRVTKK